MVPESERVWLLALLLVAFHGFLCWWPFLMEPRIPLAEWLPAVPCALSAGAATLLRRDRWVAITLAAPAAAAAGLITGYWLFPPSDPVASGWIGVGVLAGSVITLAASFIPSFAAQFAPERWLPPRLLWATLGACALYPPVALALCYLIASARHPAP